MIYITHLPVPKVLVQYPNTKKLAKYWPFYLKVYKMAAKWLNGRLSNVGINGDTGRDMHKLLLLFLTLKIIG